MSLRIGVHGARGRMGTLVCGLVREADDLTLVSTTDREDTPAHPDAQVVIDFSLPPGPVSLVEHLQPGRALVTGSTGLDAQQLRALRAWGTRGPLLHASNFSSGMNLLFDLVAQAARALPDYHLEVVEMHHGFKKDAPSGSAISLAEYAAKARGVELEQQLRHGRQGHTGTRTAQEIGMHALRGGDVAGEHTVYLVGPGERVQLGHLATSRMAFAKGAVRAARWLADQEPGTYTMAQVLDL